MAPLIALLPVITSVIDKIFPDKAAADAAKLEILRMQQNGELAALTAETDLLKGQLEINKVEAASTRLFVAGWRPYLGWICGNVIAFKYIFGPLLAMLAQAAGLTVDIPELDASELWPVLGALLGIGTMRTAEKIKGVA
ncbi:3TM-type holin [Polaromonas sp.]|uniref:3TM-type holin n=1 Tax=Polaromonas sp. TaxID=1869339 RepID=UPI003CBAC96E